MTPELFHEYLTYAPDTGDLLWKKKRWGRGCVVGRVAGSINKRPHTPYRAITIKGKKYYTHRVVWVMNKGPIPDGLHIDHIDGNGLNNKLENLRLVTREQNHRNSRTPRTNTSGVIGLTRHRGGYTVTAAHKYIGWSKDISKAIEMRDKAYKEFGYHENHGRVIHARS